MQVDSSADDRSKPYVIHITNDLYQPPQPTEMVVTSRMTQRTAGAAESAAASAAAAAVGPSVKAGLFNKVSALSTTGLHQVHISLNISCVRIMI